MVRKGARWRVGDGSKINTWNSRWVESSGGGQVLSPQLDSSVMVVKDLFLPGSKLWNTELIDQNFFPWEAESIKRIPVSLHTEEDLLIWPRTPDGIYSVKSAYQLLASKSQQAQAGPLDVDAGKRFWNGIWKLQVLNKVRHFMWRASSESLPTNSNLFKRHILSDSSCSLCEDHPEDVLHCLWLCDYAKCVWFSNQTFCLPRTRVFRSFGDLANFILTETSSNSTTLFSMVAWSIWTRRNKLRAKQQVWDVSDTIKNAKDLLQEFRDVQSLSLRPLVQREVVRWKPPSSGLFKINFDGALFDNLALAGLWIVIQDEQGLIIAALSQRIPLPSSVVMVEALAARRALIFAQEISISTVEVEGDSLQVIRAIQNQKQDRSCMGHIIQDIKQIGSCMQTCFFFPYL